MLISLLELTKKIGKKSPYCKTCLIKTIYVARSTVIFVSRVVREAPQGTNQSQRSKIFFDQSASSI